MSSETALATSLYEALVTPHLFGILCGTLLGGLLISQLLTYFMAPDVKLSPRRLDTWVVCTIAVSSTILLGVDWWNVYTFTIEKRGDVMYPWTFHIQDFITVPLAAVCTAAAQIWFMMRAWKITNKNTFFLVFNSIFIATALVCAFAILIISQVTDGDSSYFSLMAHLTIVVLWTGAIADLISTSVLVWKVLDTPITKSRAVREMAHLSFTTGALTSSFALTGGAVYLATRYYSNAFIPFIDGLPRLCALSCMITLNYRQRWRDARASQLSAKVVAPSDTEHHAALMNTVNIHSPRLVVDLSPTSTRIEGSPDSTGESKFSEAGQDYFLLSHNNGESEVVGGLHISEIGDLNELEQSLRQFQQNPATMSPRRFSVIMCEKPQRPSMSKEERRRSSGGVIVETLVSRKVEMSP